jgi:transcriptional regulator with XRE-family HTH domain
MIIKLGEALDKLEMSAASFAKELKVSPKQMSRLFRGDVDPRIGEIMEWARILETKVKSLLEDDGKDTLVITRPSTALTSIKNSKVKSTKKKVKKKIATKK